MTPVGIAMIGLILARVGAFVAVIPPFSTQTPRLVRVGFAIALAAFYISNSGIVSDNRALQETAVLPVAYAFALLRESLIGAALGFAFGLFLLPARVAGEFITQQIGLNVSPQSGPGSITAAGPLTILLENAAAILFLVGDGHHIAIATLHATFSRFPLGGAALPQAGSAINGLATAYEMGLLLAGPLAACLFLLAITLAVMSRAAPQFNIYSIGFSLQVIVLLFAGLFLLPEMVLGLQAISARTGAGLTLQFGE